MENLEESIVNISYDESEKKLLIKYNNNYTEELILNAETYTALFNKWFIETPVFISDKFKNEIKSLNYVKINKDKIKNLEYLDKFLSNTDNALKFLNYLRTRKNIIETEKLKWNFKE